MGCPEVRVGQLAAPPAPLVLSLRHCRSSPPDLTERPADSNSACQSHRHAREAEDAASEASLAAPHALHTRGRGQQLQPDAARRWAGGAAAAAAGRSTTRWQPTRTLHRDISNSAGSFAGAALPAGCVAGAVRTPSTGYPARPGCAAAVQCGRASCCTLEAAAARRLGGSGR